MKNRFLNAAAVLTVLTAGCLQAQSLSSALKADVPFAFRAGELVMPAGTYTLTQHSPSVILIRDADNKQNAFIATQGCERSTGPQTPMLVFKRYGDRYFLSQVWAHGAGGRQLPKAAVEKELARAATYEIATVQAQAR